MREEGEMTNEMVGWAMRVAAAGFLVAGVALVAQAIRELRTEVAR